MLPQSHIAYTVAAVDLLQERVPALRALDYRLLALAATGPDIVDKPLAALYFIGDTNQQCCLRIPC